MSNKKNILLIIIVLSMFFIDRTFCAESKNRVTIENSLDAFRKVLKSLRVGELVPISNEKFGMFKISHKYYSLGIFETKKEKIDRGAAVFKGEIKKLEMIFNTIQPNDISVISYTEEQKYDTATAECKLVSEKKEDRVKNTYADICAFFNSYIVRGGYVVKKVLARRLVEPDSGEEKEIIAERRKQKQEVTFCTVQESVSISNKPLCFDRELYNQVSYEIGNSELSKVDSVTHLEDFYQEKFDKKKMIDYVIWKEPLPSQFSNSGMSKGSVLFEGGVEPGNHNHKQHSREIIGHKIVSTSFLAAFLGFSAFSKKSLGNKLKRSLVAAVGVYSFLWPTSNLILGYMRDTEIPFWF